MPNQLLLDTHIWLWLVNGDRSMSASVLKKIRNAVKNNHIFISTISIWEIAMLESRGRITLDCSCHDWIQQSIKLAHLSKVPLTAEIAIDSCRLPGDFHKDPADRIIVATARKMNLTLITRDENILKYSQKGFLHSLQG